MDRNFLYGIAAFLAIALCVVYIQKKDPDFISEIIGDKKTVEPWQEEVGPLKQDSVLELEPPPILSEPNIEPKVEPNTPEEPKPEQPKRRFRNRRNANQDGLNPSLQSLGVTAGSFSAAPTMMGDLFYCNL